MTDNSTHTPTSLECKDYVKYLGVLLDSNLSWKLHIDSVALKISRVHAVPLFISSKNLLDSNLSWKLHIDSVALKISRVHAVPLLFLQKFFP